MRHRFNKLTIGGKLQAINLMTVTFVATLIIASLSFFLYQSQMVDHRNNANNLIRVLGESMNSTLLFNDAKSARTTLDGLTQTGDVRYAGLYDATGRLFASYRRVGFEQPVPNSLRPDSAPKEHPFLEDFYEVTIQLLNPADNATPIGTLVLNQSLDRAYAQLWQQLTLLLLASLTAFALLAVLLNRLQIFITQPLVALHNSMHRIRESSDLTERAKIAGDDEIGQLAQSFNDLMTDLQQRDEEKTEATTRFAAVLQAVPDLMFEFDRSGRYLNVWGSRHDLLAAPANELLGRLVTDVLPLTAAQELLRAIGDADAAASGYSFGSQIVLSLPSGADHWFELSVAKQSGLSGRAATYIVLSRDITERRNAENEIRQLAFYDALTKLPNRRLLIDRLQNALTISARTRYFGALLFLDMDQFKSINDTLGHDHGDIMLVEVAQRVQACLRKSDTVARLGGDEFVVILNDLDANVERATQKSTQVAEKIRSALATPYLLNAYERYSSPSIGVCLYLGKEVEASELLKNADIAMYQAKKDGRNLVRFFDAGMQQTVERRAALDIELRYCVQGQQLRLFYQLQVDQVGRALGVEGLVRWFHPTRGLVAPAHFIGIAEESKLIIDIGNWVLDTACQQLNTWAGQASTQGLTISVNVSAQQFKQPQFIDLVTATVRRHGIDPQRLMLELTESVVLGDVTSVIAKMNQLKALGVGLSLDDFGTGYSSLAYLKQLPLDQIKIDKSFVADVESDDNDAMMVRSIIDLARNFNLNVVAEGVETQGQLDFLIKSGCREFQGYYFSKPIPIEEFEQLLALRIN